VSLCTGTGKCVHPQPGAHAVTTCADRVTTACSVVSPYPVMETMEAIQLGDQGRGLTDVQCMGASTHTRSKLNADLPINPQGKSCFPAREYKIPSVCRKACVSYTHCHRLWSAVHAILYAVL
jgi:hypothetical protein